MIFPFSRLVQGVASFAMGILLSHTSLQAQTIPFISRDSISNPKISPKNSLGWGVSYAASDISPFPPTLMFSTFVTHRISPFFEIAASVHFLQNSSVQESKEYVPVIQNNSTIFGIRSIKRLAYSISGDITAFFSPFSESQTNWRNVRIGAGPSLRVAGMMLAVNDVNSLTGERIYIVTNSRQHTVGGHFVLEYTLALSSSIEIVLHGQATAFAPSLYTIGNTITFAPIEGWQNVFNTIQTINLGAFLRINF